MQPEEQGDNNQDFQNPPQETSAQPQQPVVVTPLQQNPQSYSQVTDSPAPNVAVGGMDGPQPRPLFPAPQNNQPKSHVKLVLVVMSVFALLFLLFFFLVLPKLVTKNAADTAFSSDAKKQQAAGPVVYKLGAQAVKFEGSSTAASIQLPENWKVEQSSGAVSLTAYGPNDYVNGMAQASINASESTNYTGLLTQEVSTYKRLHTSDKLVSETNSTIAGLPAKTLEYKVADKLGLKAGETPKNYIHESSVFIDGKKSLYIIKTSGDERQNDVLTPLFGSAVQSFTQKQ